MNESDIQRIIVENASMIGYPDFEAIRNVRLHPKSGLVDVMLLPRGGLHRLVLIEVKRSSASDAPDKVIGQLLKYYAHALLLDIDRVDAYLAYAHENLDVARSNEKKSLNKVFGKSPHAEVLQQDRGSRLIRPEEIALYVALDDEPSPVLKQILTVLDVHHNLRVGAIHVESGKATVLAGASLTARCT